MGLATAVNRLKDSEAKSKVVILLTDGDNNAGYIKPMTASEIAREFDVKVYTIGVGTRGQAYTPVSRRSDGCNHTALTILFKNHPILGELLLDENNLFHSLNDEVPTRIVRTFAHRCKLPLRLSG